MLLFDARIMVITFPYIFREMMALILKLSFLGILQNGVIFTHLLE